MKKKIIVFITLFAMLTVLFTSSYAAETKTPVGLNITGFETTDLYGNEVDSSILGEYKLTIFNFWATWCGPCVSEMPHLQKLYEEYELQGVNVMGLLCETGSSTPESAKTLCESKGYTYTTLRAANDAILTNLIDNSGGYIPVTYAVSPEGEVLEYYVGGMSYNQFVAFVNRNIELDPPTDHTVRFLDWDDTVLKEEVVIHGEDATAPEDPELLGHFFEKWDKEFTNVTTDLDVKAKYRKFNDVNDDGLINTGDAVLILQTVVAGEFSEFEAMVADVNNDGTVNTGDATKLLIQIVQ